MNPAEVATALVVEQTLGKSPAFRQIDESLFALKQGSTFVCVQVVAWGDDRALLRVFAQVVKGVDMSGALAKQLLTLNAHLRFGAFAYDPNDQIIVFLHSILGGNTLDAEELLATVRDVAVIADEYDDRIIRVHGGQSMKDLLEEAALERILEGDPMAFRFGPEN